MGGLGGPGAMKATVLAVALLATTGSLMVASILEMFLRDRTVQTPRGGRKLIKGGQKNTRERERGAL